MSQDFFNSGKKNEIAYFDAFFRKIPFNNGYAILNGIDDIINFVNNLEFSEEDIEYLRKLGTFSEDFLQYLLNLRFTGEIKAIPDGTPVFANEPLITVKAPIIEAQIIETAILSYLNAEIKYSTAARRIVDAAKKTPVSEFGARRADAHEAAILASKCAYIAGCVSTSNTAAAKKYNIPVSGTSAHSKVQEAETEYEAFLSQAKSFPENCILLVDTFDTLKSGVPNAIKIANEYLIPNGYRLKGIRIDSGDLAYLSKKAKKMLIEAGLDDVKIFLTNGLDADTILSLQDQGAVVDGYGVGDNITAPKERVGVVYKLVAVEDATEIVPKIKLSNDIEKTTNPGAKRVYRFYDKKTGFALGDLLALEDEVIPTDEIILTDPSDTTNFIVIKDYEVKELQVPIFENGMLVYEDLSIQEKREHCQAQMETLYDEIRRARKADKYYVDLTENLKDLKEKLIMLKKEEMGHSKVLVR